MTKIMYAPPGYDPTQEEHPMPGPTLSGCLLRIGLIGLIVGGIILGVGFAAQSARPRQAASTPTLVEPTAYPTYTPYPTYTLPAPPTAGLETLQPTLYFKPSMLPTASSTSTITPTPTETPLPPGFLATWTPGPWILTRFAATYETRTPTTMPGAATSAIPTGTATQRAY